MSNRTRPTNPVIAIDEEPVVDTTPDSAPEPVEDTRASLTITEPKFVNKTRKFIVRNLPKVGIFAAGAAAAAAALILTSASSDDNDESTDDSDGTMGELESSDSGEAVVYHTPYTETISESDTDS